MLKMQLQPHFLFNTLHAIAELVHEDPRAADRMVAGLGSLLRISLESAGRQMVTLREELEFLEAYLAIEQVRFRERLSVAVEIDPHALDARVPHLLLQPLVENAIRHGVAPRMAAGRVTVSARRENGRVEIEIADNGRGLPNGTPRAEGVGLRNTRARLEQLYGNEFRLELANGPAGGAVARLALPYQTGLEEEPVDQQIVAVVER
jgi:LytS/YehU family sensor histidine kinase